MRVGAQPRCSLLLLGSFRLLGRLASGLRRLDVDAIIGRETGDRRLVPPVLRRRCVLRGRILVGSLRHGRLLGGSSYVDSRISGYPSLLQGRRQPRRRSQSIAMTRAPSTCRQPGVFNAPLDMSRGASTGCDLHTTSAPGFPFAGDGPTAQHRRSGIWIEVTSPTADHCHWR